MVKVKICGITSPEVAVATAYAGADAIGLVFYAPSCRYVALKQASIIAKAIPPFVQRVGLFVNPTRAEVEQVLSEVELDLLQFHGDESVDFCQSFNKSYIKAMAMHEDNHVVSQLDIYDQAKGFLLDTYKPGEPGGTGEVFNWDWFPQDVDVPLILAGGLTVQNVQEAIQRCKPYAVDVSGGVESQRGVKSIALIKAFIDKVKNN